MENKTSKNILLAIMGVLILAEIVLNVYCCITGRKIVYNLINLIALVVVAFYGFELYKKPHGNMLKIAMLVSALAIVVSVIESIYEWPDQFIEIFLPIFAACLLFYVAGRLNRIEQNKYLLPLVAIILLACCVMDWVSFISDPVATIVYFKVTNHFVITLTLMIAYFVRFKEHKEAGLMDAPKEK